MARRWVLVLAGGVGLSAVVACGSESARALGDAMVDAAEVLRDGGRMLDAAGDAAVSDASAGGTAYAAECNVERVATVEYADGSRSEATYFYAEVAVPIATDGSQAVHVVMCDREAIGTDPFAGGACPEGATCTGRLEPFWGRCAVGYGSVTTDGPTIRVFCGQRSRSIPAGGGAEVLTGYRWTRAYFNVE